MISVFVALARRLGIAAVLVVCGTAVVAQVPQYPTEPARPQQRPEAKDQVPQAEADAINKINNVAEPAAKLEAAAEFLKKYPTSTWRGRVAEHIALEIARVGDAGQQVTLSETFVGLFTETAETDLVAPTLIEAYIKANRVEDAFRVAGPYLERTPSDVAALTQMALIGIEQAKQNNTKFVQSSLQYGRKAIELIESNARPAAMDDDRWSEYQTKWLAQLYQSTAIASLLSGNAGEARAGLEKAASLNDNDPVNYMLLGGLADQEYQQLAQRHRSLSEGPLKDEVLKQAHVKIDQVIDLFARAVALAGGDPQYQRLQQQLMQSLEQYYKYRHNGSTDGMQKLIDKYRKAS